jgi:HK97 family phage major capsid protein
MTTAPVLDQLRAERDQARDAAIALAEADDFDPTSDAFTALESRSASLDSQIERLVTLYGARQQADALDGRMSRAATRTEQRPTAPESWGEVFTRSDVFAQYPGRGTSSRVYLDTEPHTRALPTGLADLVAAGWKGGTTTVDATPPPVATPLLDAMNTITVSQNAVDVVVWAKTAGGAAKVAEKAAKPSAEWAPTVVPSTLDTIAVYTQLTRQLVEDAPAVRSLIDGELRREVLIKEEAEAAAALAAATLPTATGADLLAAMRVGIATVQGAGYSPTAALINPADWASLDVAVLGGTVLGPTIRQDYWGLRLIPSTAQAAGTVTVGDFGAGVQHYVRSGVSLYITDSHADTFLSNVFTLLAERRTRTLVTRPAAMVEVTAAP